MILCPFARNESENNLLTNKSHVCKYGDFRFVIFSQRSQMIAGQEKGKSLHHTKDKQLDDDSLKMAADDQDNAKHSGGLIIVNLFSLLIMFVMLFLFSRQQLVT